MVPRHHKIWFGAMACLALVSILTIFTTTTSAKLSFADQEHHRDLQDASLGEEEVGQLGHEQTIIVASEKDSTQAKITSSVHIPHKDATTADI